MTAPVVANGGVLRNASCAGGPGMTVSDGLGVVTAPPLIVAVITVALPARRPSNVAVYTPLPESAVAPTVPVLAPPEKPNATASPPVATLFPAASLPRSFSVTLAPDATVSFEIVMTDPAGELAPGVTAPGGEAARGERAIVGSGLVTGDPLTVPPMAAAVPGRKPVNTAV